MYGSIGVGIVANTDIGIQPDTLKSALRIVGVDETAFGAFEMMNSKRIGDATKSEWAGSVERRGVKGY